MKKIGTVLSLVLLALALVVSPVLAKSSWNANSVWPPKNHHSIGLNDFADKVKKATNGDLEIVVHTGGALGYKGPELLKTVRDGLVPISDMLISGVAGDEKLFQIVTLPFLVRDFQELRTLLEICRPYFDKAAEKNGSRKYSISPPGPVRDSGPRRKSLHWKR